MAISQNPFNITFGKEPSPIISRDGNFKEIYESFLSPNPDSEIYILSGPRGSGKTVSMTHISNDFKKMDHWIVVELNPGEDMLEQLASKLYDEGKLKRLFIRAEFSFSFRGLGFSITGEEPILNVSTLLKREFEYLKKKGFRTLITIDEVSNDDHMKVFAHEFQLFLRNQYDVLLLMTGLYQNITSLSEKEKNLTFLVRAPRIYLTGLNYRAIVNSYKRIFGIGETEAINLAKLTNGYAFAYQLLGHILFASGKVQVDSAILDRYDELLQERAYDLIYKELSKKEREILHAACDGNTNESILAKTGMSPSQLADYKKKLFLKGILTGNYRTTLTFSLPRFKEFLIFVRSLGEE